MKICSGKLQLLVLGGFLVLGLVVYAPSINGPLQFDDKRVILDPKVRERRSSVLGFLEETVGLAHDSGGPLGTRSLVHASFLLDWRLWGEKTWPYHVENVLIHVITAWLVFVLVGQILNWQVAGGGWHVVGGSYNLPAGKAGLQATSNKPASPAGGLSTEKLAVLAGLIFLLHPIQSQAVAYIAQRFESMMAMFYLAAITTYLHARKFQIQNSKIQTNLKFQISNFKQEKIWFILSLAAGLAASSCKEVAITLPAVLMMVELLVVRRKLTIKNWLILGLFWVVAAKIPLQIMMSAPLGGAAPTIQDVARQATVVEEVAKTSLTRTNYLLTQINVVRTYIRLLIVPVRQSLDYDYPLTTSFWQLGTVVSALLILGILGAGVYGWKKSDPTKNSWNLISLGIGWFFMTLSVSSSVIPIRDLIYEHRVYLPMVGFVLVLVVLVGKIYRTYRTYRTYILTGIVGLLLIYVGLTLNRSFVWASEVRLWGDAWKKAPNKDRTNKNFGFVLTQAEGRLAEGITRLERAVELNPEDQDYRITLGAAYLQAKDWGKAKAQFEKAVVLKPNKEDGWNNLGVALFQLKDYAAAKENFEKALAINPDFQMAWLGLGGARMMTGDMQGGVEAFETAIRLLPDDPRAYSNLLTLYIQAKDWKKAWEAAGRLEIVDPKYAGLAEKKAGILKKLKQ